MRSDRDTGTAPNQGWLRRDDTNVESYLVLVCDLAPDGRLARIEAFLRRTA